MQDASLLKAKEKYNLKGLLYDDADTWEKLSELPLTEDFIREFRYKVNWYIISEYQTLSESFIKEFDDMVDWKMISEFQDLSEDIMRRYIDTIPLGNILWYQNISEIFKHEINCRLDNQELEAIC